MAYGNNETEFEGGAPKKADVLIRSTQAIAVRQQELGEQIKLARNFYILQSRAKISMPDLPTR